MKKKREVTKWTTHKVKELLGKNGNNVMFLSSLIDNILIRWDKDVRPHMTRLTRDAEPQGKKKEGSDGEYALQPFKNEKREGE